MEGIYREVPAGRTGQGQGREGARASELWGQRCQIRTEEPESPGVKPLRHSSLKQVPATKAALGRRDDGTGTGSGRYRQAGAHGAGRWPRNRKGTGERAHALPADASRVRVTLQTPPGHGAGRARALGGPDGPTVTWHSPTRGARGQRPAGAQAGHAAAAGDPGATWDLGE